jgi:DNA-binding transcriptional MerR regulator
MKKGNDPETEYTVNQLARVLNISRSTLLYYESVGLITPFRKEGSQYRAYRNKDILNLMNALMLRNAGLSVNEIAELQQDNNSLTEGNIALYCNRLSARIEYLEAIRETLTEYRQSRVSVGEMFAIVDVPRYYYVLSNCDLGWDKFNKNPAADALLAHMPLTGIGGIYEGSLLDDSNDCYWGRFVPEANLRFIDVDKKDLQCVGGCKCLRVRTWGGVSLMAEEFDKKARKAACAFLEEQGYRSEGCGFTPYLQPSERTFFELYQPVVPR